MKDILLDDDLERDLIKLLRFYRAKVGSDFTPCDTNDYWIEVGNKRIYLSDIEEEVNRCP